MHPGSVSGCITRKGRHPDGEETVNISRYGNPNAGIVLIQLVDDHDLEGIENEVAEIQRLTAKDFWF